MEGKDSQKDILRLRQLEQTKQDSNSTAATSTSSQPNEKSTSIINETDERVGNGYPPVASVISEKMNDN